MSLEEIAETLAVSVNTVKTHVRAVYAKVGARTRRDRRRARLGPRGVPVPLRLILDDVHELVEPGPIRALAALVRERPPTLRLVLAGRADPPLPLARLRLAGQVRDLRARDLAFSRSEAGALLDAAGVPLTAEQLGLLVERTAGWPAGVRLAALSLREAPDADAFLADLVGNSRATSDYLVGEILSRLPDSTCDLLRAVSICDQLPAGLAVALAERADAGEVLAGLEDETSLVLSSGQGRAWYRIHPLLRAHLRLDLRRRHPEAVGALHGRAANWFATRGHQVPALLHAQLAADPGQVATLVRQHAVGLVVAGEHTAVQEALRFLADHGRDDAGLALLAALAAIETGAPANVEAQLTRAVAYWPSAPDPGLVALLRTVRLRAAAVVGDLDRIRLAAAELDAADPDGAEPGPAVDLAPLAQLEIAFAHLVAGRPDDARTLAETVLADARRAGHGYLAVRASCTLAMIAGSVGDHRGMATLAERADDEIANGGWGATGTAALVSFLRAYAAWLDASPLRCLELLGPARTPGPDADALAPLRHALRGAALTDLGRAPEALPELRLALTAMGAGPVLPQLGGVAALIVHGAATTLERRAIAGEARRTARDAGTMPNEVLLMDARRAVRRWGEGPAAVAALRPVLDGTEAPLVPWTTVEAHVVACGVALEDGRRHHARRELDRALNAAAAMAAPRPLLDATPAVLDLLARQIGSFGPGDAVGAPVLDLHGERRRAGGAALTARERQILGLLATPASLDDIAADLAVAPSTVKTHVRAIYTKLGVGSRRDAVSAARRRAAAAV
jgi:LuxR family maltose regulon positive regulatory protein